MGQSARYRIEVAGRLRPEWVRAWLGEAGVSGTDETTVLEIRLADQPALFGVLAQIRDLGLELLSVTAVPSREEEGQREV